MNTHLITATDRSTGSIRHFLLTCCLLLSNQVIAVEPATNAYLRSAQIQAGDIAELVIEYHSQIPSLYALDTSVLESDYELLNISSSVARVYESEQMYHRMQWIIELLPRRSGSLTIPSLKVGAVTTAPLNLEVAVQPLETGTLDPVFIEIEAQPDNPYVGQQTQLILRVFNGIPGLVGNLHEPAVAEVDIFRDLRDSNYLATRQGHSYQVLERTLVLIAQSPGEIEIPPTGYRGVIHSNSASATNPQTAARLVYRQSNSLRFQVRDHPAGFSGERWLPARHLELTLLWDDFDTELKVGDTLGLTLRIEARGLAADSLPANLLSSNSERIKIYPDHAQRSNRFVGKELRGRLEQRFAIIVTQAGEIRIPETKLKWWNLDLEREEIASATGHSWQVVAVEASSSLATNRQLWRRDPDTGDYAMLPLRDYRGLMLVFLAVPPALLAWLLRRRLEARLRLARERYQVRKILKRACLDGDPVKTRAQLLQWSRVLWPGHSIHGLHQLASLSGSSALSQELCGLDAALFANQTTAWQGLRLWRLIVAEERRNKAAERTAISLPQPYPQAITAGSS
jgi:hypothetical protein